MESFCFSTSLFMIDSIWFLQFTSLPTWSSCRTFAFFLTVAPSHSILSQASPHYWSWFAARTRHPRALWAPDQVSLDWLDRIGCDNLSSCQQCIMTYCCELRAVSVLSTDSLSLFQYLSPTYFNTCPVTLFESSKSNLPHQPKPFLFYLFSLLSTSIKVYSSFLPSFLHIISFIPFPLVLTHALQVCLSADSTSTQQRFLT